MDPKDIPDGASWNRDSTKASKESAGNDSLSGTEGLPLAATYGQRS